MSLNTLSSSWMRRALICRTHHSHALLLNNNNTILYSTAPAV
jgi:hypothetical protein